MANGLRPKKKDEDFLGGIVSPLNKPRPKEKTPEFRGGIGAPVQPRHPSLGGRPAPGTQMQNTGFVGSLEGIAAQGSVADIDLAELTALFTGGDKPLVVGAKPVTGAQLNAQDSDAEGIARFPSLGAVLAAKAAKKAAGISSFPEENNKFLLDTAVDASAPIKTTFQNLDSKTAQQRAEVGARFGAATGLSVAGPVGAVIGTGVGAMNARALGLIQTGEHEDQLRRGGSIDTLKTMGIIGDDNRISFEGSKSVLATPDQSLRLQNASPITGEPDRSLFEIDKSNPLSNRTANVARVFARVLNDGILGFADPNNPRDTVSLNNNTGMFANLLQSDADSIAVVYARAKQLAAKFGISEKQMRTFFDANKTNIDERESADIRQGIDIIYA